jgi:predicted PhzF superfamily epimerase YddE/YHI9
MKLPLFQLDAFASRVFSGNPAAIVPLEAPLEAATMQAIAMENNLSETAYIRREGGKWSIPWFTPGIGIDLCGHATLAAAWVEFHRLDPVAQTVTLSSKSGDLSVAREGDLLFLDFPSRPPAPATAPPELAEGLRKGDRLEFNSRKLATFLRTPRVRLLPLSMETVERYGNLSANLVHQGRVIPSNDVWFAAQALQVGATLVTRDAHFDRIDGLSVVRPGTGSQTSNFLRFGSMAWSSPVHPGERRASSR